MTREELLLTRKSELKHLISWAENKQSAPMMWFYGHIGTGKTTIVTALHKFLKLRTQYISLSPENRNEILLILKKATVNNFQLIIIDNFDLYWSHERLLELRLLPLLKNGGPKLLLVGRKPLPKIIYNGPLWTNLFGSQELLDLDKTIVEKLLAYWEIAHSDIRETIWQMSRGRPLLIKEIFAILPSYLNLTTEQVSSLWQNLFRELTPRIVQEHPNIDDCLTAAAFVRYFNRELLEDVTGSSNPHLFRELTETSLVLHNKEGYHLEPVLQRVLIEATEREKAVFIRTKVVDYWKKNLAFQKHRYTGILNVIFAGGNRILQELLLKTTSEYQLRPVELYQDCLAGAEKKQELSLKDMPERVSLGIFMEEECCLQFKKGVLDGYKKKWKELLNPPILEISGDLAKPCFCIYEISLSPLNKTEGLSGMLHEILLLISNEKSILIIDPPDALADVLKEMALNIFLSRDQVAPACYWLDPTSEGIVKWLDRIIYSQSSLKSNQSPLSATELSQLVREALNNLGNIEDLASSPLADILSIERHPGEELKRRLEKHLAELQKHDKHLSILVKASLRQQGLSRKELARNFNISERTFYRRLNLAYYKLGQLLMEHE